MLTLVAYKAFADAAAKGVMFVITVLAARRLPQEAFGVFAVGATVGWLAALASDFGLQVHVAREAARHPARAREILQRWLPIRLASASAAAAMIAAFVVTMEPGGTYRLALLLFAFTYLAAGGSEFLSFFLRGLGRTDLESTLTLSTRAATLASAVLVLIWRPEVTLLSLAMLGPALVSLAAGAAVAWRAGARPLAPGALPSDSQVVPARSRTSEFGRDVLPLGAAAVLAAFYFRVDVLMINSFAGAEAVGLYTAVFRLVEALRLFPAAVLAVALPLIFQATDGRPLLRISSALTGFAIAVTAVLWILAGWLVPWLFGESYRTAVPAFRVLLLAFPLMSLNYALTHQLIGWNRHVAYAALCGCALAANVILNLRLIPALSIAGAAWATVATEIVLTIGCAAVLLAHRAANRRSSHSLPAPAHQVQPL